MTMVDNSFMEKEMDASTNNLIPELIATLEDGTTRHVCIGLHWTAVVVERDGELHCGLASTMKGDYEHGVPDVPQSGILENSSGLELAGLATSLCPTLVSVGMAAINALLPRYPDTWVDLNAEEVIASLGKGQSVALVGHFPFVDRLRGRVRKLSVLEINPRCGDLPVSAAPEVIPDADLIAVTGMTLLNRTFQGLIRLCSPGARVMLLGPSVPLSPVLFRYGVNILSGSVVTSIDPVLAVVRQGGNFRQVHKSGVRLVTVLNAAS